MQVSVSSSSLCSFASSDQPRISPQAMKRKAIMPDAAHMKNPPSLIISCLEAGLYLYNRCCWPIISIYFFHDSSAESACQRPWACQSEHSTNVFPSFLLTFNGDENKSPKRLCIIRYLICLMNTFKSQAQELKHLVIYCFDIKNRESQSTEEIGSIPCTEIAKLHILHGTSDW